MSNADSRLAQLEREVNGCRRSARRDRLVMGGLGALVAVLAVGGTGQPEKVIDELRVKKLTVVDENGEARAVLGVATSGSPYLRLADEKGKSRAMLVSLPDGTQSLYLYDEKGNARTMLGLNADGSPGLIMQDENGKTRAILGASEIRSPDGTKTTYPESTLVVFGPDEKVLWKTPSALSRP